MTVKGCRLRGLLHEFGATLRLSKLINELLDLYNDGIEKRAVYVGKANNHVQWFYYIFISEIHNRHSNSGSKIWRSEIVMFQKYSEGLTVLYLTWTLKGLLY
jgi:hypothetical protein